MKNPSVILLAAISIFFGAPAANAMSVSPIVIDMNSSGNKASQVSVVNDSAKALPVEIVISSMELDEKGEMNTKPAGDEFLVFPPQAMVAPGSTQVFRIQWAGDPAIKASKSYVFSVNQVPVKMPEGKSGVQVVFNFGCIVNVAPQQGTSTIEILKTGLDKDDKGKQRPAVTVKNSGNIHAKLTDATIKLSSGSWSQILTPEALRQLVGLGLVQPGKARRFVLPVDLPTDAKNVTINLEYKQPK
jgi:fimbrial chaperone protein